jgi:hypothetical protein
MSFNVMYLTLPHIHLHLFLLFHTFEQHLAAPVYCLFRLACQQLPAGENMLSWLVGNEFANAASGFEV